MNNAGIHLKTLKRTERNLTTPKNGSNTENTKQRNGKQALQKTSSVINCLTGKFNKTDDPTMADTEKKRKYKRPIPQTKAGVSR